VTIVLLRHAWAGHREGWDGDDTRRPLDARGHDQALALVDRLASHPVDRILSSPYTRCVQTVEPLAAARGVPVEPSEELGEERQERDGLALLHSLAGTNAVVCTHGGSPWNELAGGRYRKGEAVVLDDDLRPVDVLPPP
jgi:phosphohistidine phosphatase SixA